MTARGFLISSQAPLREGGRQGQTGRPVNPLSKAGETSYTTVIVE